MTMTRVPLLRRRLFSQRALRRHDDYARSSTTNSSSSSAVSSRATAPQVQHALDGRSYLLPTMTLQRAPGTHAIATATPAEGPLLQTRARKTPIVLDLQLVSSDGSPHANPIKKHELRAEMERLNALGFIPVGITNASEDIKQLAQKLHLPYFISTRMQFSSQQQQSPQLQDTQQQPALELEPHTTADEASAADVLEPEEVSSAAHASAEGSETPDAHVASEESAAPQTQAPMVVYSSVRSGQQIFAQNRALVVLGNVNSGAEVLADGDIYVMGALKGRALAGIGGDVRARITCQSFDAELVSIAHHFTTCDDLAALPQNGDLKLLKPTTVCVQDDQLHFQSTL